MATQNRVASRMNGNGRPPSHASSSRYRAHRNGSRPRQSRPTSPPPSDERERQSVLNPLDRAISWVAPGWAQRRLEARLRARALIDYYDGATIGRRGASIRRTIADPNAVSYATLSRLRAGAHDLVRNNQHAQRGVGLIEANVIGTGIQPQFLRDGERAEDIEELAARCLRSTICDADGRNTYGGIQALAMRTIAESGEVLIRRRFRRPRDGFEVPVQFQVLEPDYLDDMKNVPELPGGGQIVQGVEFDAIGRRRGYWLFKDHPGSLRFRTSSSSFVPAESVIHAYRVDRPGQVRGIPWLAPLMLRMADLADYEDAQLVRQKIAACFVGFWQEAFGSSFPSKTDKSGENVIDSLEPGMFERLPPGSTLEFGRPPEVSGYEEYIRVSDRRIAAALGVSYEALTGDLSGVNFSSARMGWLEFQRNIGKWQTLTVIPQICDPLSAWWLEALELAGVDTDGVTVRHVSPRREMIDPTREIPAEMLAIRAGLKTVTQSLREQGRDPREHLEELAADMEMLDELGLVLDSDVRKDVSRAAPGGGGGDDGDGMTNALLAYLQEMAERDRQERGVAPGL